MSERPDPSLGVFETLLVRDGRVQALDRHVSRLARSVSELYALELPDELRATISACAATLPGDAWRLRVDAVADGASLRIEFETSALSSSAPVLQLRPVVVPGGLGAHKWADRVLVDSLGRDPVPLLVDSDQQVLEASWANFWLLEGEQLVTPPTDGRILPGVTRGLLLELAPSIGLEPLQEPISLARARAAPASFLSSALRLVVGTFAGAAEASEPRALAAIRSALDASGWD